MKFRNLLILINVKAVYVDNACGQCETLHRSGDCDDQKIYSCNDCDYRMIVERYLVDHKNIQHTSSGNDSSSVSADNALRSPTSLKTRGNLKCTKNAIKT